MKAVRSGNPTASVSVGGGEESRHHHADVPCDAVEVILARQVVFRSAALDCPDPGRSYIQVLTNGYWVVPKAGDTEFDYRASIEGEFRPCVGSGPPYDVLVDRYT